MAASEGSILNPRFPAAVGARAMAPMSLPAAVFRALASAVSDIIFMNGGLGARPTKDGINVIGFPANRLGRVG